MLRLLCCQLARIVKCTPWVNCYKRTLHRSFPVASLCISCVIVYCVCYCFYEQTRSLYLFEGVLSFWNGFQFSFPTILSYILIVIMMKAGLTSYFTSPTDDDPTGTNPGDLAVASGVIVSFIGETACVVFIAPQ